MKRILLSSVSHLILGLPLAAGLMVAEAPQALAQFTVSSGTTSTTPRTLSGNQTGTVQAGGTLQTTGAAVTQSGATSGAGVTLDNAGTIRSTGGRGFDTSGGSTVRTITLINRAGALFQADANDAFRVNTAITSGSVTISNSGTIRAAAPTNIASGVQGQALDLRTMARQRRGTHRHQYVYRRDRGDERRCAPARPERGDQQCRHRAQLRRQYQRRRQRHVGRDRRGRPAGRGGHQQGGRHDFRRAAWRDGRYRDHRRQRGGRLHHRAQRVGRRVRRQRHGDQLMVRSPATTPGPAISSTAAASPPPMAMATASISTSSPASRISARSRGPAPEASIAAAGQTAAKASPPAAAPSSTMPGPSSRARRAAS